MIVSHFRRNGFAPYPLRTRPAPLSHRLQFRTASQPDLNGDDAKEDTVRCGTGAANAVYTQFAVLLQYCESFAVWYFTASLCHRSASAPHSHHLHFWTFAPLRSHFSSLIHEKCERSGAKVQKWRWCEFGVGAAAERCGKIPNCETFTVQ